MKTQHKEYMIVTTATKAHGRDAWVATLEILNADRRQVVAPFTFGDLVFSTEAMAHRAGVLLARYWIDGGHDEE